MILSRLFFFVSSEISSRKIIRFLFRTHPDKSLYAQSAKLCRFPRISRTLSLPPALPLLKPDLHFDRFSRYQSGARQRKVRDEHSVAEGITSQPFCWNNSYRCKRWLDPALTRREPIFYVFSLYNKSNVYTYVRACASFSYMKVRPRQHKIRGSIARSRAHYDSLLSPFVSSPVLRFLFALFSSSPSSSPPLPRTTLVPLFPDLHHLLALHPLQLVGAADTCRASASATDGKRRGRKEERKKN